MASSACLPQPGRVDKPQGVLQVMEATQCLFRMSFPEWLISLYMDARVKYSKGCNIGALSPPGDIWQCLETVLITIIEGVGASGIWQVEGWNAVQNPTGHRTAPQNCWPVRLEQRGQAGRGEARSCGPLGHLKELIFKNLIFMNHPSK